MGEQSNHLRLNWLESVVDPRVSPELEALLIAAGNARAPEVQPYVAAPVLSAIARLGDVSAVQVLDQIARERPYPGAQFLIDDRDRLIQIVLQQVGKRSARERGLALGLPIDAELSGS